eukprot:Rmarinus@m.11837
MNFRLADFRRQYSAKKMKPLMSKPNEVARYEFTADGSMVHGAAAVCPAFRTCAPPVDLNLGFEERIAKQERSMYGFGLGVVLEALRLARVDPTRRYLADVVTFRNNLNKLCGTVYFPNDGWRMEVQRYRDTIYLDIRSDPDPADENSQRGMFWGRRFEEVCTRPAAHSDPRPCDPNAEFCRVVSFDMNGVRCFMAAEIDCRYPDTEDYVELKTSKCVDSPKTEHSFRRWKLPKFYIQSHLGGVDTIFVGFRDNEGILRATQKMRTADIPNILKQKDRRWDRHECIGFASAVLRWVLTQTAGGGGRYSLWYDPQQRSVCLAPSVEAAEERTDISSHKPESSSSDCLQGGYYRNPIGTNLLQQYLDACEGNANE